MSWTMNADAEDRVRKDEKLQIAKELKNHGAAVDLIIKSTGFRDEIESL